MMMKYTKIKKHTQTKKYLNSKNLKQQKLNLRVLVNNKILKF